METIQTDRAPEAVGAYSQGKVVDELIITSGQIPLDPSSGELVDDPPEKAVRQCLDNIIGVVESGGGNLSTILKTRVFLENLDFYDPLNSVYREYFESQLPARTVVEVSDLPGGANLEIEATARQVSK
jgi:2-iminobutanoate/2-iminopropanoate deaminase